MLALVMRRAVLAHLPVHMQHLSLAGCLLISTMEQDALPPSPAPSSSDEAGLSPASPVLMQIGYFKSERGKKEPWDLIPPGAMTVAAASEFMSTGERHCLDCLEADFPVAERKAITISDIIEDESSDDADVDDHRGAGTAEQRAEAVDAVLRCSSRTTFDVNHVYLDRRMLTVRLRQCNGEDVNNPDARRVRPRLGPSPGSLSSSSSPPRPRFPGQMSSIPQLAVSEANQQDTYTISNEEQDKGMTRTQISRYDVPRHNAHIVAGQLISPNDRLDNFLPSMSGLRSSATVADVANVLSYIRAAIAREGLGHERHRTVYNNANDAVRNMQEAINAAARDFHPRDAIAAARASLLALDAVFRRAMHPPQPDRFGNTSGRIPFLLAIASVKLFDPILLSVRDNRFIYLAHRMALDLIDADEIFWLQQWVRVGQDGPWTLLPPNSWDPRFPQPEVSPRQRWRSRGGIPAFRPPGQAMLSPTDFDVFETATMYPIQLTASGSLSLRAATLWVSKVLADIFPAPVAQLMDSYLGHQQPFRDLLSSSRAWVKKHRPDWLTCTQNLVPLSDMDTLEPSLDDTFEGHFFNVYMRRGIQMKYRLQAMTRERADFNRIHFPNAPSLFTWPDAEAVAQGHRNPELSHLMSIARMRMSPTHYACGRNLDADMAELSPFNFSRSSAEINGDMLLNPRFPSSPPQLFNQLYCQNCFEDDFSAGDSCYQCNVCVDFVFCTECYQDQGDMAISVRRHRRSHTMTHFVVGATG